MVKISKNKLPEEIFNEFSYLLQIIQKIKKNSELYDDTFKKWENSCLDILKHVEKGLIKVAVTGAVKSGKSTFVNSIFHADFLKRGSGVLTSVVTKIRKHDKLKAKLEIRSWDEINLKIEDALLSFDENCSEKYTHFDLRRSNDKKCLKNLHEKHLDENPFSDNQIRPEMILINNVLQNYEFYKDVIKPNGVTLELENDHFDRHKVFTGDPSKAFLIKDVILELDFGNIDKDIEIADCQGIDSTDITQISEVLEYLESSNLIIYLIGSRTGLREADIRFLSIINKMGLGHNVLFVVNCDLGAHESLEDLISVEKKIKQDLCYFNRDLNCYSFSSLYNLFHQISPDLTSREKKRIKAWESEKDIIKYCNDMSEIFFIDFENKINKDRNTLIIDNPLQRLKIITKNMQARIKFFSDILCDDEIVTNKSLMDIKEMQSIVLKMQFFVENSIQNIYKDLKGKTDNCIEDFFRGKKGSIIAAVTSFVNNYDINSDNFQEQISTSDFPKVLYFLFQNFKKEFDFFLVEKINPELVCFIKELEKELEDRAGSLFNTYKIDMFNLYNQFGKKFINQYGFLDKNSELLNITDIQSMKKRDGLKPPSTRFTTQYNARIKISSFTGFGIHSLLLFFIKKSSKKSNTVLDLILKKASLMFKKEVLRSIKLTIDEYKKKLKQDYFEVLIEAVTKDIKEVLIDQFQIYSVKIDKIETIIKQEKYEQKGQKEFLLLMLRDIKEVSKRVNML